MSLKVTSHLQRPKKIGFLVYLDKLNSNIEPEVSIGKFSEIFKRNRVFFKQKLVNQKGVMISDLAEFSRQPLMLRLDFCAISIFCLHRALYTIHTGNFLLLKKSFLWINQRRKKVLGKKKKKKKRKRKKTLSNKDVAVEPKFAIHNVKNEVSYFYANLDTKTLTIASNFNFESFLSIHCLLPQQIFQFFPFLPPIFPLPLTTLLIDVLSSSTPH